MPEAAQKRSIAFHQMGKELTGVGAVFVNRTQLAIEKDAAVFVAFENAPFFFGFYRVIVEKDREFDTQKPGQVFGVARGDRGSGDTATIGTSCAIDLFLNILGDGFQAAFDEVVAFEPGAETLIFGALFFAEALDLDQVGKHCFQYRNKSLSLESVLEHKAATWRGMPDN